jgi:hypothetical protein
MFFDLVASSGAGAMGCTPNGCPWCSIARVKGRFGRRASLGQRLRRRVYCFAIYGLSDHCMFNSPPQTHCIRHGDVWWYVVSKAIVPEFTRNYSQKSMMLP